LTIRLLDTGLLPAARNMALDGIILEEVEAGFSPPTFRFLRFDPPAALVGYNQDLFTEIRVEYCQEQGIELNRRHTGGGAILFEPSMLGFELFWPVERGLLPGGLAELTGRLGDLAARALTRLGVPAAFRPRNDIEIEGRKVSGTGLVFLSRAWMFQGTVLIDNCLERMLRALRVPVEKLKKREILSLLQRLTFLADELGRRPRMEEVKAAFREVFQEGLGLGFTPAGLTEREKERLGRELGFYSSDRWIRRGSQAKGGAAGSEILRARLGRLEVTLWADLSRRSIKQALIRGDFFTRPKQLALDLEASLRGVPLKEPPVRRALAEAFTRTRGEFDTLTQEELIRAVVRAVERGAAPWPGFGIQELNRIHPLGVELDLKGFNRPEALLLPYCAKDLGCAQRHEDGCDQCGLCQTGEMYNLALKRGLEPITVTSFEHLMEVLRSLSGRPGASYIGSCCQAFLAKHQEEMVAAGPKGIIVNLDSLTCYDLGKETEAYAGRFEKQSRLEAGLLAKVVDFLTRPERPAEV